MLDNQSDDSRLYALFGGTFDPVHYGHLRPIIALAQEIGLTQVSLLPNHLPPHRPQPLASAAQRLAMLKLAVANQPLFAIDERELHKSTPSYTIETLQALRDELGPERPLAFIIGQDSLLTLSLWYRWQKLLDYCHLLVCGRPGFAHPLPSTELQTWFAAHHVCDSAILHQQPSGAIYLADTPLIDISATEIRQRLACGDSCQDLLPEAVHDYIQQQGLYGFG